MSGPRRYSVATRAALAQLSRGLCYNPDCPRRSPIIGFRGDEPYIDYQIAHIRDANVGNRYVADMSDEERRAFANLVLCTPCHVLVDKTHPQAYGIERLEAWKQEREASAGPGLAGLAGIDEDALAELVTRAVRTALGNPGVAVTEARGVVRVTAAGGLPRLLPLEPASVPVGATVSPTRLVRARSGVVPFTVHQDLRRSLLDWCLDGVDFSARIVGGGAGAGKTRLAVQLCEDLAPFEWVRGLLTPARDQAEMEALVATPTARLVVIDYAEARADQVASLVPRLAACATAQHPVRVLLAVRAERGGDWAGALRGSGEALDALDDKMALNVLDELPLVHEGRHELFAAAAGAFARRATAALVPEAPDSLEGPAFATPLLVVVKAYLEVHGSAAEAQCRNDLLDELLRHEDSYWQGAGSDAPRDPVLRRRVVALATLAGAGSEARRSRSAAPRPRPGGRRRTALSDPGPLGRRALPGAVGVVEPARARPRGRAPRGHDLLRPPRGPGRRARR